MFGFLILNKVCLKKYFYSLLQFAKRFTKFLFLKLRRHIPADFFVLLVCA